MSASLRGLQHSVARYMEIYPAIDLMEGRCVRLLHGGFASARVYGDPLVFACSFARAGARWLHVVDLDGARLGRSLQSDMILRLCAQSRLRVQCGGGIRTAHEIGCLLHGGVSRVIVGSKAFSSPRVFCGWLRRFGGARLVLALDVRMRGRWMRAATNGWRRESNWHPHRVLSYFFDYGLQHVLVTDISRDGALQGLNLRLYRSLSYTFPHLLLQASGGVCALADVDGARRARVSGLVIGKALYEDRLHLSEALTLAGGAEKREIH